MTNSDITNDIPEDAREDSASWADKRKARFESLGTQDKTPRQWDEEHISSQERMFMNRVKKRKAHLWKWARRSDISCFRIYDRDIPELPFIIDFYDGWLHVSQIVRSSFESDEDDLKWGSRMAAAAGRSIGIDVSRVFFKPRTPQKGHTQYEKFGSEGTVVKVKEAGLVFELNLSDYLDTGLFLDHRETRLLVRDAALGKRVLNLFSYTGSFSLHAAAGGAESTVSVDLSNTYTEWARRNLANNGFIEPFHTCVASDVGTYLEEARMRKERYDIIILDPPTFSNSKKMEGTFDVQRDHPLIIRQCLDLLKPQGVVLFSNNFKKFKLSEDKIHTRAIEEITSRTIPEDFMGHRPHRAWIIRKN